MRVLHTIEQHRPGDLNLLPKMVFAFLFIFVIGAFIYALIKNGAPSVHEGAAGNTCASGTRAHAVGHHGALHLCHRLGLRGPA